MLEIGLPEKYASEAADVSERTFHYWCEQGRNGVEPYASFLTAVERARALAAKHLLTRMLKGEKGSAAAQWLLDRRFPREFGSRVMLGGIPDGDPIRIDRNDRIRESSEACRLLHEAIVASAAVGMQSFDSVDGDCDENGDPEP
jgi:hypothetical protein